MGASAMMDYRSFTVVLQTTNDSKGTAGQVVDLFDGHQAKRNDMKGMGGRSQVGDLGRLTELANNKAFTICGEAVSYDDVRSREEQLKLDIALAFEGEVAQMGEFIAEVMASLAEGSPLPQDQKDQIFEMISEVVSLRTMMNKNPSEVSRQELETKILKIAETLLDGMDHKSMPTAIVNFVHGMLSDVQKAYALPALDEIMTKIEGRMNPENYLTNSVAEVIAQLTEMLEADDLSEEAQAEIESLIEKMEQAIEKGEPVPRDVMQALESLSENYPEISLKSEFTQAIETLKDANIVAKAEALGLSVAQVQEIESTIEKLEAQSQDLNEQAESKAELESLIESLQAFVDKGEPLTPEAAATIETIIESRADWTPSGFETPSVETSSASAPSLSSVIASIVPSPSSAKPTAANSNESSPLTPETSGDAPVTQPEKPETKSKEPDSKPGANPSDPDPIDIGGGEEPDVTKDDRDPQPDKIEKDEPTNEPESVSELKQKPDAEPDSDKPDQPTEDKKLDGDQPTNNPETPPESDQPEQKPDGNKGPCADGLCDCFAKVADTSKSLQELKESIKNNIGNPDAGNKEINDTLVKNIDQLSSTQKKELIADVARDDFSGDVEKAQRHVEAVFRLQQHEQKILAQQKADKASADIERQKRFEAAESEKDKTLSEKFKPKGCPQHGEGGCPDGSHGTKIKPSTNKKSARERRLKR